MHKLFVEQEFLTIKKADFVQDVLTLEDFKYAFSLVTSRAWESSRGVSMIPFADFANHSDLSETIVLSNEEEQLSEVIADYSYAPGDEVLIRYGKFSNARLLLDFGFTLPCNKYEQVQVELSIPHEGNLRQLKLELLSRHKMLILKDVNGLSSSENSFALKEINDLAEEAAENDGRLARRPLKDKSREIEAHQFLQSKINEIIEEYNASIKSLELPATLCMVGKHDLRRQMAQCLLIGELRVLKSAALWLENYCATLFKV
uniref:Ribulose-1,5 bisphosphate carboxylase/oxygenase large subunit N-methyltransferase, chloroplastic-like n=1 Tax=Nicotiana tabacum TaxID=4097 RepID=A0A1S3X3H4_TOBAC|nr:PREDICTED: ribulose-1,5 bisphosphate carboxylase/oxygenase large subunit N-methyltransferase, chloroplastic-like [Nicotiana tabacum]